MEVDQFNNNTVNIFYRIDRFILLRTVDRAKK